MLLMQRPQPGINANACSMSSRKSRALLPTQTVQHECSIWQSTLFFVFFNYRFWIYVVLILFLKIENYSSTVLFYAHKVCASSHARIHIRTQTHTHEERACIVRDMLKRNARQHHTPHHKSAHTRAHNIIFNI